jgi:hypothetical protein
VKTFRTLREARDIYGGSIATWRRWAWTGQLGKAVKRFGRRVVIDTATLDSRLARTGQLLDRGRHEMAGLVAPDKNHKKTMRVKP